MQVIPIKMTNKFHLVQFIFCFIKVSFVRNGIDGVESVWMGRAVNRCIKNTFLMFLRGLDLFARGILSLSLDHQKVSNVDLRFIPWSHLSLAVNRLWDAAMLPLSGACGMRHRWYMSSIRMELRYIWICCRQSACGQMDLQSIHFWFLIILS